jgi:NADH-quinone oxidoreductase subunit N
VPATAGFIGKVYLIDALVTGDYAWLAIVLVVGSMISLGYYLRVVAAMWMRDVADVPAAVRADATGSATGLPAIAGGSQEADGLLADASDAAAAARPQLEVLAVAWIAALATIVLGCVPQPLFELAADAGRALTGIF